MSIQNKIRVVDRVDQYVVGLKIKYSQNTSAHSDLSKMNASLKNLRDYLTHLDQLQPNYTTNEVDKLMTAVDLDLDILKGSLESADYKKLQNGIGVIKTILKFHPTKYSFFEFILIWFYELIYFI